MNEELEMYLDKYLNIRVERKALFGAAKCAEARCFENVMEDSDINSFINNNKNDDKFQMLLFKYIDRLNKKDSEIYNKANIDRRLFSKIRSNKDYHPSKNTVISLGLALELNEDEIVSFLNSASYSLPFNNKFDLIIRFCFINKIYDINEVNNLLFNHDCPTLEKV